VKQVDCSHLDNGHISLHVPMVGNSGVFVDNAMVRSKPVNEDLMIERSISVATNEYV
jgi:hypothetical protein